MALPDALSTRTDVTERYGEDIGGVLAGYEDAILLDLGCGATAENGYFVPASSQLLQVDPASRMLDQLGEKQVAYTRTGFDLAGDPVQAEGYHLPFRDDTFDAVHMAAVPIWITASDVERVLKHGGDILWISAAMDTYGTAEDALTAQGAAHLTDRFEGLDRPAPAAVRLHGYRGPHHDVEERRYVPARQVDVDALLEATPDDITASGASGIDRYTAEELRETGIPAAAEAALVDTIDWTGREGDPGDLVVEDVFIQLVETAQLRYRITATAEDGTGRIWQYRFDGAAVEELDDIMDPDAP